MIYTNNIIQVFKIVLAKEITNVIYLFFCAGAHIFGKIKIYTTLAEISIKIINIFHYHSACDLKKQNSRTQNC